MKLCKQMPAVIAISLCLIANVMAADTWHLSKGKGWQKVSNDRESEYLLAVSRFKKAVISGQSRGIATEFAFLKDQFPELAGPDLDAFMVAESAYSKRKYDSALKHYDTFLNEFPDSWLYESALERKLAIATAYLNGQKRVVLGVLRLPAYDRGEKIIREIVDRAGQAPIARRALYVLAEAQKKNDKHLDEYETWAEISSKWPTGDTGKQSQFGMAYSLHSAYKGPKYDGASLASSRTYYENIRNRYPQEAAEHEIEGKISMVDEQRAYKEYMTGEYYMRAEYPEAANICYRYVIDRWPDTTAARLAREKLAINLGEMAAPVVQKDIYRKAFDAANIFLDDWVGMIKLDKILRD